MDPGEERRLDQELVDQVIFGMENQEQEYYFDISEFVVVSRQDIEEEQIDADRYVELPEWNSSLGFQLMERFVTSLRNPIFGEVLRQCLSAGKGVFRRFKDALKERPDIERMWFRFKEREMRRYVLEWYNTVSEARGLEKMDGEPAEDTAELVLSDFQLIPARPSDVAMLEECDRHSFGENLPELPAPIVDDLYRRARDGEAMAPDDVLCAVSPEGEVSGFLWSVDHGDPSVRYRRIVQLYVRPEYRGLGLAKVLLDASLEAAHDRGVQWAVANAAGVSIGFSDKLRERGFVDLEATLAVDLRRWGLENRYS